MTRLWISLLAIVGLIAGAALIAYADDPADDAAADEDAEESTTLEIGADAADFTLANQDGEDVSLSDYDGKVVVLEWVNWQCPYVQAHYRLGSMTTLVEEFGDDIVWIGINSSNFSTPDHNKEHMGEMDGVTWDVLSDASGDVGRQYGATHTPHIMVINAEGKLIFRGAIDADRNIRRENNEGVRSFAREAITAAIAGETPEVQENQAYGCTVKY